MKKIFLQSALFFFTTAAFGQGEGQHGAAYNFGKKYVLEINYGIILVLLVLFILVISRKKKPPKQ